MNTIKKTLLFGIGNYGRQDDGLGWLFLDRIQKTLPNTYDIEYRYQLQIEDAELATNYDCVIFIDAHINEFESGYIWRECHAKASETYTSHELDPEVIVFLTNTIYQHHPKAFLLGISGTSFQLELGLSATAEKNLEKSLDFFIHKVLAMEIANT